MKNNEELVLLSATYCAFLINYIHSKVSLIRAHLKQWSHFSKMLPFYLQCMRKYNAHVCLKVVLTGFLFLAVLLALASLLFVIRLVLVVWRHVKQPLYADLSPEAMEPKEIAQKQKKMFR